MAKEGVKKTPTTIVIETATRCDAVGAVLSVPAGYCQFDTPRCVSADFICPRVLEYLHLQRDQLPGGVKATIIADLPGKRLSLVVNYGARSSHDVATFKNGLAWTRHQVKPKKSQNH